MGIKFFIGCMLISTGSLFLVAAQENYTKNDHPDFFDHLSITATAHKGFVLPEYEYFLFVVQDYVQSVRNIGRENKKI